MGPRRDQQRDRNVESLSGTRRLNLGPVARPQWHSIAEGKVDEGDRRRAGDLGGSMWLKRGPGLWFHNRTLSQVVTATAES